jgi:coenzyme F420-reducing hydrogenase beta subunit
MNNEPAPQDVRLAQQIAEELDDETSFTLYLSFTQKYSHEFLEKLLERVLSVPEEKIKKTKGALFTHLVMQHGRTDSGD